MIIYIVNVTVKREIEEEWLQWMRNVHIPNVLSTGYFINAEIFSVILPATGKDETTYSVQYRSDTYEKFMSYSVKESKRLQKEHTEKFGSKIHSERMLLEQIPN